jgi:hypothetical protein
VRRWRPCTLVLLLFIVTSANAASPAECSYRVFKWDTVRRVASPTIEVRHAYSALTQRERDSATGCSVCEQDQERIELPGLNPFRICRKLAPAVRETLMRLILAGEPIHEIDGYRVGLTRGTIDAHGYRTQFSNHSYGIAIDINPKLNGLYHHCTRFGPQCQLMRGGPWRAGTPGTLTSVSHIVRALGAVGLRWGGEIDGTQKDFMHFSPTGY